MRRESFRFVRAEGLRCDTRPVAGQQLVELLLPEPQHEQTACQLERRDEDGCADLRGKLAQDRQSWIRLELVGQCTIDRDASDESAERRLPRLGGDGGPAMFVGNV